MPVYLKSNSVLLWFRACPGLVVASVSYDFSAVFRGFVCFFLESRSISAMTIPHFSPAKKNSYGEVAEGIALLWLKIG